MQNKGFVKIFAVLLTLVCLFYLSFSFVVSHEEDKIESWANKVTGEWVAQKDSLGETVTEKQKTDYFKEKKEEYLEKNKDKKVWLGVYTLQKGRELQIGLGLDLKGGLSVTLEVSAPDFLKSLTAGVQDSEIEAAIRAAQQAAENNGDAIDAFVKALPESRSLASIFANSVLKDKISLNSTNEAVVDVIRGELKDAVDNSYSVIRSRVDRFGVAQPNIQKLGGGQGRIMVELPGVENKQRVIELLTRSSNLQFWEAYTANEIKRVAIPSLKNFSSEDTPL